MTENGYQIGEVVKRVPERGNYDALWEAAEKLTDGEALPITFPTNEAAVNRVSGLAANARARGLQAVRRGNTIYFTKVKP